MLYDAFTLSDILAILAIGSTPVLAGTIGGFLAGWLLPKIDALEGLSLGMAVGFVGLMGWFWALDAGDFLPAWAALMGLTATAAALLCGVVSFGMWAWERWTNR